MKPWRFLSSSRQWCDATMCLLFSVSSFLFCSRRTCTTLTCTAFIVEGLKDADIKVPVGSGKVAWNQRHSASDITTETGLPF